LADDRAGTGAHDWLAREHLGIGLERAVAACEDQELVSWYRAAQTFPRSALPTQLREAELPIVVPLGGYRLYARYDLLALDPGGQAVIVDWKTMDRVPSQRVLAERIQTRVYLFTLIAAGAVLCGGAEIDPKMASMVYWFATAPNDTVRIGYSADSFARDRDDLARLISHIATMDRSGFLRSEQQANCGACNYRTLCDRDSQSADGTMDWADDDLDLSLELDDIPELDY